MLPCVPSERLDGECAGDHEQGGADQSADAQVDPREGLLPISVLPHERIPPVFGRLTEYRVLQAPAASLVWGFHPSFEFPLLRDANGFDDTDSYE